MRRGPCGPQPTRTTISLFFQTVRLHGPWRVLHDRLLAVSSQYATHPPTASERTTHNAGSASASHPRCARSVSIVRHVLRRWRSCAFSTRYDGAETIHRHRSPARSAVLAAAAHVLRSQQCAFGTSSSWQRAHRCNASSDDRNTDRRRAASRQSPALPSIISRRMSAWPACRPVSRITCRYTHRNVSSLPCGA